ncbi:uncharacterized protein LOC142355795, partial [Convolutriloba macropyga]|uniref:uncharacterized protein LOC142355795 n=1 Tax=Convolutriloba macropyga TaxID=536237 RepID=UPI003F5234DD
MQVSLRLEKFHLFPFCSRSNTVCTQECIASSTGDSCLLPFTLQGTTFTACIEGTAVDSSTYTNTDYVCPLQFNATSNEYFDFKICGGIGGSCSIAPVAACFYNPCQNGGTCQDTNANAFGYTCECDGTGFVGQNCSTVNPCTSDPCNGGSCSVTGSDAAGFGFECNCSIVPDFLGDTCSISNPCGPSNDPCNGGVCTVTGNAVNGFGSTCDCSNVPDFLGENCSLSNPCGPSNDPCNGGVCTLTGDAVNGFGSKCNCSNVPQFLGDTCSIDNPCLPDPCNGGICEITGDESTGFDFTCNCSNVVLFVGPNCNISDPCTNPGNPCNSNPCTTIENNGVFEASCNCITEGTQGDFCDPDPCYPDTCNGGNCTITGNGKSGFGFECNCSIVPDQLGDTCSLDNPCLPDPCSGGKCEITGDQSTGFDFACNCSNLVLFVGPNCNISDPCTNPGNPCNSNPCTTIENNGVFEASCNCITEGTQGDFCDPDPCYPDTCNGGNCTITGNGQSGFGFECNCSIVPDQLGDTCSLDNPCLPDPCSGGVCEITGDQSTGFDFACNCSNLVLFVGPNCNISDPCTNPGNPCNSNPCTTIENNGVFEASCNCITEGTQGDFCDPDPCYLDTCNGGNCTITGNGQSGFGFECNCSIVRDQLGDTCSLDNPCLPDPCSGGVCEITGDQSTGFDFACNCSNLVLFVGPNCNISDPCTNPGNPCNSNPCTTIENNGVFEASCNCISEGTQGDFCDPDPCYPDTCNGGNCTITGNGQSGFGFECNCSIVPDQLGDTCSLDNPCLPDPCSGGVCEITGDQSTGFDFACNCSNLVLFVGPNCNISDPCTNPGNPCNSNPCTTIENNGVFEASCNCITEGTQGDFCDPDPCYPDTCNGGNCTITGNGQSGFGFECNCSIVPDQLGDTCSLDNPCLPDPCSGGVCEITGDQSTGFDFACNCSSVPGFVGRNCNVTDPCTNPENPCNTNPCSAIENNGLFQANCSCPANGTVGDFCDPDPCLSDPCNPGTCDPVLDNNGTYQPNCTCPEGRSGDRCETINNPCDTLPCQNDATCIPGNTSDAFTCVCKSPWFGKNCTIIDQCASDDPCLNNGLCFTRSNGTYFCKCINNWAGENCTQHPNIFVQCGTSSMVISMEKSVIHQLKHETEFLHVLDRSLDCQFTEGSNDSYYVKEVNFQQCGTEVITINDQSVIFCQQVRASTLGGQFISGLTAILQCNLRVTGSEVIAFLPGMQSNALETEAKVQVFPLALKSYNASALSGAFV